MFLRRKRDGPKDRRRAVRVAEPALAAFYWTGGVSNPCCVRDISREGAYIETTKEWCSGTVLQLILESKRPQEPPAGTAKRFGLWARVAHADAHGMGMEFILADREGAGQFSRFLEMTMGLTLPPKSTGWVLTGFRTKHRLTSLKAPGGDSPAR